MNNGILDKLGLLPPPPEEGEQSKTQPHASEKELEAAEDWRRGTGRAGELYKCAAAGRMHPDWVHVSAMWCLLAGLTCSLATVSSMLGAIVSTPVVSCCMLLCRLLCTAVSWCLLLYTAVLL